MDNSCFSCLLRTGEQRNQVYSLIKSWLPCIIYSVQKTKVDACVWTPGIFQLFINKLFNNYMGTYVLKRSVLYSIQCNQAMKISCQPFGNKKFTIAFCTAIGHYFRQLIRQSIRVGWFLNSLVRKLLIVGKLVGIFEGELAIWLVKNLIILLSSNLFKYTYLVLAKCNIHPIRARFFNVTIVFLATNSYDFVSNFITQIKVRILRNADDAPRFSTLHQLLCSISHVLFYSSMFW